jgi:hypothetical protein
MIYYTARDGEEYTDHWQRAYNRIRFLRASIATAERNNQPRVLTALRSELSHVADLVAGFLQAELMKVVGPGVKVPHVDNNDVLKWFEKVRDWKSRFLHSTTTWPDTQQVLKLLGEAMTERKVHPEFPLTLGDT